MAIYRPHGIKKYFHDSRRSLASRWLSLCHPRELAVTGSQGKTSVSDMTSHVLSHYGRTVRTDLTLDTTYNVPITALRVRPWTKYVFWELGIDHPGEMERHLEIARPTIGCITGISPVHTDPKHMGSLDTLIREKRKLIEALPEDGTAILNGDDVHVVKMAPHTKARVKWYGSSSDCDIYVKKDTVRVTLDGTTADFMIGDTSHTFSTKLIGTHHVYTIMASYLLSSHAVGKNITQGFAEIISHIAPLRGRMSVEKGPKDTVLLNDSLRANPESTSAGLTTLAKIPYEKGRKIAVIGEMGELENPEDEHRKTGQLIAKLHLDYVLCIGPLRKHTIDEAIAYGYPPKQISYAHDVFEASDVLKSILRPNDLWYLKGSLLRNYKRIVQLLNNEPVCCREMLCPYDHCGYRYDS